MVKTINKNNSEHYQWGNNCSSWILSEKDGLSIKQESMPASTKEQLHYHEKANQFFFVLKGEATFYCENEIIKIKEQDGFYVPSKTKHFIANESEETIEFLVISQPSTINDRINV